MVDLLSPVLPTEAPLTWITIHIGQVADNCPKTGGLREASLTPLHRDDVYRYPQTFIPDAMCVSRRLGTTAFEQVAQVYCYRDMEQ